MQFIASNFVLVIDSTHTKGVGVANMSFGAGLGIAFHY